MPERREPPLQAADLAFRPRQSLTCEQALNRAVDSLASPERRLLYNHLVLNLSIDMLGQMYGVNRTTAARRIQRALRALQRRFSVELELGFGKLDQDVSQLLNVTLRQLLNVAGGAPAASALSSNASALLQRQ